MKAKEKKLIITFNTTTEALAFEAASQKSKISGKLIPVPRVFSAGCGLAWLGEIPERRLIADLVKQQKLSFEDVHEFNY